MLRSSRFLVLIPLLLAAVPAAGQDSPDVERLKHLRFERMQEALELNDEQIQALHSSIEEFRRQSREAREAHRESMEGLRQALEDDDGAGLEEALADLKRRRVEARERETRHEERLAELLRPEQRARFLLFHDRFDSHLRELINRHRRGDGPHILGPRRHRMVVPPPAFVEPMPVVPPMRRGGHIMRFEPRMEDLSPEEREQHIERLRRHIEALQERLEEMERPSG